MLAACPALRRAGRLQRLRLLLGMFGCRHLHARFGGGLFVGDALRVFLGGQIGDRRAFPERLDDGFEDGLLFGEMFARFYGLGACFGFEFPARRFFVIVLIIVVMSFFMIVFVMRFFVVMLMVGMFVVMLVFGVRVVFVMVFRAAL